MFFKFKHWVPVAHPSSYVHPQASVIGNVIIGKNVYIGPHATIRGDWGKIIIADGCNVQESCTIHMFPGVTVILEEGAHIGHGAIIHGAHICRNVLIGMNAVVMDNVVVGEKTIVGALSFIKNGEQIPPRSLVVGNPAKVIREVTDEMIAWKTKGTEIYQALPLDCQQHLAVCDPLVEIEQNRPEMNDQNYKPW